MEHSIKKESNEQAYREFFIKLRATDFFELMMMMIIIIILFHIFVYIYTHLLIYNIQYCMSICKK